MGRQSVLAATGAAALMALSQLGAATAAAAGPVGSPSAPGPLLDASVVATVTGAAGMTVISSDNGLSDNPARIQPRSCVSVHSPAQKSTYAGLQWVSASRELLVDGEPGEASALVEQAVVTLGSETQTLEYLNALLPLWQQCSDTTLRITPSDGQAYEEKIGTAELHGNTVLTVSTQTTGGTRCERALAGKGNLVLDVNVCQFGDRDVRGQARTLVQTMLSSSNTSI